MVYTRESSVQRLAQAVFIVVSSLPSSAIKNALTTGSLDKISHFLLRLDQQIMDMCSVQLLCPRSSSPIQTVSDSSLHRDQNLPCGIVTEFQNIHASRPNSNHRSISKNSSHLLAKTCQCRSSLCDTSVQDTCVSEHVSDFRCSTPDKPVFECLPFYEPLALLEPLDCPLDVPSPLLYLLLHLHSWTMTCSACISCRCICLWVTLTLQSLSL